MNYCTYASVAQEVAMLAGEDYDRLTAPDLTNLNRSIQRRARAAWLRDWWPELMRSEERRLRDTWSAAAYAEGDQVWHEDTAAYYEANDATLSSDLPGTASNWTLLTELNPYVGLEQPGETAIGLVRGVYDEEPAFATDPRRLLWAMGENGIHLLSEAVPASVWVWFKLREGEFNGADYSAAATYASGARKFYASSTVGYEGDYWTATAATTAGQSPETHPSKWERVEFPAFLRPHVAQAAYADWLRADGQTDKAMAEEQEAERILLTTQLQALGNQPPLRWRVA